MELLGKKARSTSNTAQAIVSAEAMVTIDPLLQKEIQRCVKFHDSLRREAKASKTVDWDRLNKHRITR